KNELVSGMLPFPIGGSGCTPTANDDLIGDCVGDKCLSNMLLRGHYGSIDIGPCLVALLPAIAHIVLGISLCVAKYTSPIELVASLHINAPNKSDQYWCCQPGLLSTLS